MVGPGTVAVDAALRAAVERGDVPQLVAVAADDAGLLYEGASGPDRTDGEVPVGTGAVFRIASMTKAVTTVAALQLVERHRLDLDAPVHRYLPEFGDLPVLTGFDGDRPVLRPPRAAATVRQLMTHTAGLGYWFFDADLFRWERVTGTPNILSGSAAAFAAPLTADPGTRFGYGIGTDWLGRVVEAAGGQTLDTSIEEHVTGPLGMSETTFRPDDALRARLVPVHRRDDEGRWRPTRLDWTTSPDYWPGGHGLYSTANDYLRLQRALLAGGVLDGVRVLSEATVDDMFTNHLGDLSFPAHLPTAHPASSADLDLGPGLKWGLGLLLTTEDSPGRRAAGSGSWAGIYNTHFWIDRRRRLVGAVYTQTLPFADPGAMRAYAEIEAALYAGFR
jgi:methyl acetate hydrolase